MHECGASLVNLPGTIDLKKPDPLSPSNHQLSRARQPEEGCIPSSYLHAAMLTGSMLCNSCIGTQKWPSCCEFMSTIVLSHPEDTDTP